MNPIMRTGLPSASISMRPFSCSQRTGAVRLADAVLDGDLSRFARRA